MVKFLRGAYTTVNAILSWFRDIELFVFLTILPTVTAIVSRLFNNEVEDLLVSCDFAIIDMLASNSWFTAFTILSTT